MAKPGDRKIHRDVFSTVFNDYFGFPRHTDLSHAFCSVDAKQEYEHLGLGTPPILLRQNSLGRPPTSTARHTDEEGSLRRRAVKVGKKFFPQF